VEDGALNAYKFLRPGAVGPFSGARWRPGEWVEGDGLSACERRHLPLWIWEELWEVELGGAVVSRGHKLRAPRARLGRRIEEWTPTSAKAFASACAWRAALHASGPLRDAGFGDAAETFAGGGDLQVVRRLTSELWDELPHDVRRPIGVASDGASDALDTIASDDPYEVVRGAAVVAYTAAMTAQHLGGSDAYDAERAHQADWLAAELGLV
jgi:hypothetical protein